MNQNVKSEEQGGISIELLFGIFMKNILLFIAVILLFIAGGVAYIKFTPPVYSANNSTIYLATTDKNSSTDDYNITLQYYDTVVSFCSQPIVLDRANFYYNQIVHLPEYFSCGTFAKGLAQYEQDIKSGKVVYEPTVVYAENSKEFTKEILKENLSVTATRSTNTNELDYFINLSYNDKDMNEAKNKLQVIILAIKEEANVAGDPKYQSKDSGINNKYFGTYNVSLTDANNYSVTKASSDSRVILITALFGFLVAVLIVYILHAMDRTVHNKEELERITGTNLIAVIADQEAK